MKPDTQIDAWEDLQLTLSQKQQTVRDAIFQSGDNGTTLFELERLLRWPINRISGRVTELSKSRAIVDSGSRRVNPLSGKRAIVWRVP